MKKTAALIVSFVLAFVLVPTVANAAGKAEIVIDKASITDGGKIEVIGHLTECEKGTQVAVLLADKSYKTENRELQADDIVHIDQTSTGNNGTFLFQTSVKQKWSEKDVILSIGSNAETGMKSTDLKIPELPPTIDIVDNNSVLFGRDCYAVTGPYYMDADRIAESFAYGGNNIYFKLGDNWYNLLDKNATSNAYLKKENAVGISDIEKIMPRYYYAVSAIYTLRYVVE